MSLDVGLVVARSLGHGAFGGGTLSGWALCDWPVRLDVLFLWAIRLVRHSVLLLFRRVCAVLLNKTGRTVEIFPRRLQIRKAE
ncbi:MAG: hypothetical protein ACRDNY_07580 [Gaiellaceae bacterium]